MRVRQRTMQDLGAGRIKHAIFLAPDNLRRRRQSHHVLLQMRYFGGEVAEDARMQVVVMRRGDRQFMCDAVRNRWRLAHHQMHDVRKIVRRFRESQELSRSEELREGKECVRTVKSRLLPYN